MLQFRNATTRCTILVFVSNSVFNTSFHVTQLALRYHDDTRWQDSIARNLSDAEARAKLQQVRDAFHVLRDDGRRRVFLSWSSLNVQN